MSSQKYGNPFLSLVLIVLIVLSGFSISPQKANAGGAAAGGSTEITQILNLGLLGLIDAATAASAIATNLIAISTLALEVKEYILDPAAYILSQIDLSAINQNIVNKILNSNDGYVEDLEVELLDIQQQISTDFAGEVGLLNISEFYPGYKDDITDLLELSSRKNYESKFAGTIEKTPNTITDPAKFNDGFIDGGGWDSYEKTILYPKENDAFIIYSTAQSELSKRQQDEERRQIEEFAWGRGVRPLVDPVTGEIIKPAALIETQLNEAITSSLRVYENVDEIDELILGLLIGIINDAVTGSF